MEYENLWPTIIGSGKFKIPGLVEHIFANYDLQSPPTNMSSTNYNIFNDQSTTMKQFYNLVYDKFDEYTKLITITDKQVYAHNYNYNYYNDIKLHNNKVTSTKQMSPFKRTTSYNTKHYYCGFCSKIIKIPEFMYQDKAFCTVQCRTNQMNAEKKNPVREHHSFSI